ncbi:hypothetical protein [Mesorhizobium australafricanum]|uniref:Uncharacterized protein n=1 Tax=Mesorhizobium australafricanum TaxID=3072311 RepID=A0ABU4WQR7_9HYPH|nr:hypothetical protein [Mesorhizobium sp. VK3E]MDX8438376.1 hypothetical protein [Mesorhizobium sp. VK3E]
MSAFFRRRLEDTIEHLITILDELDGDPDVEPETVEEQHDIEAEPGTPDRATLAFVLAETTRRYRKTYR